MILRAIDHIFTLQRSPIALAPVIHHFFASSQPRAKDLLLSYLVLPMVLYPATQDYLAKVRKTSNLRTLCNDQARLIGLTQNTQEFKSLTHAALLVLQAERAIEINDDLSVKSLCDVRTTNANSKLLEASSGLAKICAEADIVSIYRTLGFKSL